MRCSLIVSVYKDTESLDFILKSLINQTILPDEIIISEDGNSSEMADYIPQAKNKYSQLNIIHLFQEDLGWRKNRALNRAIVAASYEYLIFIDGDCIPYSNFIEGHLADAQKNQVLSGKRLELGPLVSERVKSGGLKLLDLQQHFLWHIPSLLQDKTRHLEDGLSFKPKGLIANLLHRRHVRHIIGCNFSCFKSDFLKINGFNEDFILPCEGEDVDPSWRFRSSGIEIKSCRCTANIFHLHHEKRFSDKEGQINREIMHANQKKNTFYCLNGINKITD